MDSHPTYCPGCGKPYAKFNTHFTMADATAALWVEDSDCQHQGYATKGAKLAYMHQVKVTAWLDHLARCVPASAQDPAWWGADDYSGDVSAEPSDEMPPSDRWAPSVEVSAEPWSGAEHLEWREIESEADWCALVCRIDRDMGCVPIAIEPERTEPIPLELMSDIIDGHAPAARTWRNEAFINALITDAA